MFRVGDIQAQITGDAISVVAKHYTNERRPVAPRAFTFEEAVEFRDEWSKLVDELADRLDQRDRERDAARQAWNNGA